MLSILDGTEKCDLVLRRFVARLCQEFGEQNVYQLMHSEAFGLRMFEEKIIAK